MLNKIKIIIGLLVFSYAQKVYAAEGPLKYLKDAAQTQGPYADADEKKIFVILGNLVAVFLGLLGVIFLILIMVSGYNWMTASGDESKYEKAKDTMYRAIIGLLITAAAYAISYFVLSKVTAVTLKGG